MIPKKVLVVAFGFIVLFGLSIAEPKKKSSKKLQMMMEQRVKDDKEFDERIAREQKEREEKEAAKSRPGFFVGRINPETYEYKELSKSNNWMTPNEATKVCEKDLKCAGFTFRGSLDVLDLPTFVYFVHHFPKEILDVKEHDSANWVSYRAKRPFVVLQGQPLIDRDLLETTETPETIKFKEAIRKLDSRRITNLKWPFNEGAAAMTFLARNDEIYRVNRIFTLAENNELDKDYITVLNSHDPEAGLFISDETVIDIDNCCADVPKPLNINWFYDEELDETIETISCDKISREEFEEKYVRKRQAVKIVGCVEQSDLEKWSSVKNLIDSLEKTGSHLSGRFLVGHNETSHGPNLNVNEVRQLIEKDILVDVKAPIPSDMTQNYRFKKNLFPEDLLVKAGKKKEQPNVRIQSASTGSVLETGDNHGCTVSTLLKGSRWWIILPADSAPKLRRFSCSTNHCSDKTATKSSILSPRAWFSHMFAQLIRRPLYGRKPVQTVQRPGEIIYIPGNSPYAFYNVDETIDVTETFFSVANVEMLTSIKDFDETSYYQEIYDKVANKEEKQRMSGASKQTKQANKDKVGAVSLNGDGELVG